MLYTILLINIFTVNYIPQHRPVSYKPKLKPTLRKENLLLTVYLGLYNFITELWNLMLLLSLYG